jgi:hypothetical protein
MMQMHGRIFINNQLRFFWVFLCAFYFSASVYAQELAGIVHSNYAGVNSVYFNPAGLHHQKDWLSVNLITANVFLSNDYAYLSKDDFKFFDLFSGNLNIPNHPVGYSNIESPFYIYDRSYNTRLDLSLKIQGPSAMYIYKQHAFALYTGARTILNARNITPDLGRIIYYGFGYDPQHNQTYNVKNFNQSLLSWGEIGFTYSYQLNVLDFHNYNFGITIKRLIGVGGTYVLAENTDYNVINDTTLDLQNLNAQMAFSLPMNYNTDEIPVSPYINGGGWGFDLGFEYQVLTERQSKDRTQNACAQKHWNYKYRIGASIMDIGWIKFKNNAQFHEYKQINYLWNNIDTTQYENFNQIIQEISYRFYGDSTASLKGREFTMWLPASLNIDGDYNFENDFYLNTSLIFNLPINGSFVRKPSILSITPRYEKEKIEVNMPLSLYQWRYPRLGLSVRFYYFTIGSDYFTSLFGWHDFSGMDLYFSLKFNLSKGSCSKRNVINPCGDASNRFRWSN